MARRKGWSWYWWEAVLFTGIEPISRRSGVYYTYKSPQAAYRHAEKETLLQVVPGGVKRRVRIDIWAGYPRG